MSKEIPNPWAGAIMRNRRFMAEMTETAIATVPGYREAYEAARAEVEGETVAEGTK